MQKHNYALLGDSFYLSGFMVLFFSKVHLEPLKNICPFYIYIIPFSECIQFWDRL
ncbi:hypothetical protein LEP1GSC103_1449 [Leptospira borgpetersenii serovar Javanica str. UI 09931]|uniref:Uncharacterized protein n=5 Tax=Leptospira borgpetersenii TaxID=174 RepID=M3GGR2_LEPBO|nr:hypothetical protein LBBP_01680 [Leptospira borgpetersenii serovar Ballum]EKP12146.1 hypothetical protein LEP1GSC128_0354 [Leptospira borgpetersenii str. 200801926]EKQ90124.1 hypothetical protein LEP1GSC101_2345 [Leptospira borgpetersenii str. UI 09149]EKR00530.1 hypothetical protein LEP1GSC121_1090 [Leptospira borgpetersenii serovar Castellonis str. 200801910]EMG00162.1 hypothetical protein LEP1GSC123_1370 [Leptospira borgpetersenii str. 200701203]EMK08771.1 hypothetical protein LEP1GSC066